MDSMKHTKGGEEDSDLAKRLYNSNQPNNRKRKVPRVPLKPQRKSKR